VEDVWSSDSLPIEDLSFFLPVTEDEENGNQGSENKEDEVWNDLSLSLISEEVENFDHFN